MVRRLLAGNRFRRGAQIAGRMVDLSEVGTGREGHAAEIPHRIDKVAPGQVAITIGRGLAPQRL
jgi:hypothetical protein